jgi:YggT family protein
VRSLLCNLLGLYLIALIARIVLSWFPLSPGSALVPVYNFLHAVTEPVLAPVRRMIPSVGVGGMGLDLSPIIILIVINLLQARVC